MTPNIWDAVKAFLRGKFIAIQSHLKEQENSQITNLILHIKQLEKEQPKSEVSRKKAIIKIREEINEIKAKKEIAKINKSKSWLFEKINKIDTPLARFLKEKKRRRLSKIRNEKAELTTDIAEI